MKTYHLHITGQVQGVGFRPYVYVAAFDKNIVGWVKNTIDGVHIRFNVDDDLQANDFVKHIIDNAPRLSIITGYDLKEYPFQSFETFSIVHSDEEGKANLLITPDFAMCADCREELKDPDNRRNDYPFITCTNCGPRYSIITKLPYDRPYTTMDPFRMCPDCNKEYNDPLDRRYFSQTNSCPECAVQLSIYNSTGELLNFNVVEDQIDFIVESLQNGDILALKGIGGYLLICDATDEKVVQKLRERKHRPSKAFAMMFPDLTSVRQQLHLNAEEEKWLTNEVSSIVLLQKRSEVEERYAYHEIAPGLDSIGVMLPYTPLYELILSQYKKAILATSGNLTNEPIVFDNEEAIAKLGGIADFIVTNNRDIVIPQDDSVLGFSRKYRQKIILRRSRGLAPGYLDHQVKWPEQSILAMGGELKSTFTFLFNKLCYISQYLGDLEDFDTQQAFSRTLDHFTGLFTAKPDIILHDKHPGYYSTILADEMSARLGLEKKAVQHHKAHFAAILGEKNLIDNEEPVLGLIWDGTGYGDDGNIWGGEIFVFDKMKISRKAQIEYFDFILGDKMPREPRISALAIASHNDKYKEEVKSSFSPTEWNIYQKVLEQKSNLKTSSAGRLFDAAANIVLGIDVSSYEGEAAMFLEVAARDYYSKKESNAFIPLDIDFGSSDNLDSFQVIGELFRERAKNLPADLLAFKFHCTLVRWAEILVGRYKVKKMACSGGVFQNGLLADLLIQQLKGNCSLFFHDELSPNDECISFGQLVYHVYGLTSD